MPKSLWPDPAWLSSVCLVSHAGRLFEHHCSQFSQPQFLPHLYFFLLFFILLFFFPHSPFFLFFFLSSSSSSSPPNLRQFPIAHPPQTQTPTKKKSHATTREGKQRTKPRGKKPHLLLYPRPAAPNPNPLLLQISPPRPPPRCDPALGFAAVLGPPRRG